MGSLKPGATYIYERADGVTYAREQGSAPNTRFEVGRDFKIKDLDEHNEWIRIRLESKKNPALRKLVEQIQIIYRLSVEKYD